ncbi:MAG: ABC transporter substrate-binding protein [Rhizobiales bacterium]|nr:ABC transporter substrate-binding protein [Hyphomicrobiales bacterium]NRB15485.1 ABC transporter substrate-binding protein [Hyphomicrobiales bacterium]
MGRRINRITLAALLLPAVTVANAAGIGATVANPMDLKPAYANQLELKNFESQAGESLSFTGNPLFADQVSSGSLPKVGDRLPSEPLVVMPISQTGEYGGILKGTALALESGTSEILSWRQVNLVRLNPADNSIVPNVAKSWEWNADKTEITFTLREGHKWSDGDAFDADDVVFFVNDIMRNEELTQSVWGNWAHGGETVKIKKIDNLTFTFIFAKPNPVFLHYLATSGSYFTPWAASHVLKQYHIDYNENADEVAKAAGFESWKENFKTYYHKWKDAVTATEKGLTVPTLESHILAKATDGQTRAFVANPYYFKVDTSGNQLPYIDRHNERFLEKQIWTLEVINGNIDQKSQNVDLADFPLIKENEAKGDYSVHLDDGQIGPVLVFNYTIADKSKAFAYGNANFRKAMSVAINRDDLIEQLYLGLANTDQAMPANIGFATAEDRAYMTEFDPAAANKMLDDMGMTARNADGYRMAPDGSDFKIFWEYSLQFTRSPEFPLLIAEYWRAVGIDVLLKEVTTELVRQKSDLNELEIGMEWDLPFEWTLIAEPKVYSAPWAIGGPITGATWVKYWATNGAEGEKPPVWVEELRTASLAFASAKQGSDEYMALGAEMVKLNLENMVLIGTAGAVPQINIVSNKLANVPTWNLNAYRAGFAYSQQTDQWSFK